MAIKEENVSTFYQTDAINYASYDNLRKLACVYDGLKVSQRKLLFTMREKYSREMTKTESFSNITAARTQYLHGAASLCGVASLMAQGFVGANNYPLFTGNSGGFGNRINGGEYAAPRYTKVGLANISKALFDDRDDPVLIEQIFEGDSIEYKYFMPIFPVILLNGSEGLSTGFAETIYPRNPKDVIKYIIKKISGTASPRVELAPWFKGFKGSVRLNKDTNVYESVGVISMQNTTTYEISELPIGTQYQKYIEFLDKLEDSGVIVSYSDECDTKTDEILFNIKTSRDFTKKHSTPESLLNVFKLVKSLPETLCFINENNSVNEYDNIYDMLNDYIDKRLYYYGLRKANLLKELKAKLEKLVSKYMFCDGIIKKTIIVANKKKDDITKQLEKIDKIIKIDDKYDYLTNMPIHSVSRDTMEELKKQIVDTKEEFKKINDQSEKDMWTEDLKMLEKSL